MKNIFKKNINIKIIYFIAFIAMILNIYRISPYLSSNIPLWYDPWLYRIMFVEYFNMLPHVNLNSLSEFTSRAFPPLIGFIWIIFQSININVDIFLTFWVWFLSIITGFYVYLLLKKYGAVYWIIGLTIFSISIIQYQTFWWAYSKQIIWILFMLSSLYLLEKKKIFLSVPLIIGVFTLHRPTWLYFLLSFFIYKLIRFFYYKDRYVSDGIVIFICGLVSIMIYLPFLDVQILSLFNAVTSSFAWWQSGTFLSKEDFWKFNILVILVSIYWLYIKFKEKDFDTIFCGYVFGIIWLWFWLFFFTRMYIFIDIFIILTSAYAFGKIYENNMKHFFILFIIFFALQSSYYFWFIQYHKAPLIGEKEFEKIEVLGKILPEKSYLMITHKHYSPWVWWYSWLSVITPGLLGDTRWNKKEWLDWWSWDVNTKCDMLNSYRDIGAPIYIWNWEKESDEDLLLADCLKSVEINWHQIYKVTY